MSHPLLQSLRRSLRAKFPAAHGVAVSPPARSAQAPATAGLPAFPEGGISEIVSPPLAPGTGLLLSSLLRERTAQDGFPETALVDAADRFDPCSHGVEECTALLWLRCRNPEEALRCTDLLALDGNLPRVILDLAGCPVDAVRRIPPSVWQRWKQPVASHAMRLIAINPVPCVPCPALRLSLVPRFGIDDFARSRDTLRGLVCFPMSRGHPAASGSA
jgi:hypothetical protein